MRPGNVLNQISSKEISPGRVNEGPEGQVACVSIDAMTTQGMRVKNGTEPMKKEAGEVLLRPLLLTENCFLNSLTLLDSLFLGIHSLNDHFCFQVQSNCPTQRFSPKNELPVVFQGHLRPDP